MTEQNKTPLTAQPGSAPAPEQKPAEKRPAEKPLRRVGSLTLGACLIAAGVFFLLYFFVPGFDVQLTLKIAPAVALVLLVAQGSYTRRATVGGQLVRLGHREPPVRLVRMSR